MTDKDRIYVDDRIENYVKSVTAVLLSEIQDVKSDIKDIKADVKRINGNVRDVCEWRAGHQAVHDTKEKGSAGTLKFIGVIIAFLAMSSGVFFGFKRMNDDVDEIKRGIEYQVRRQIEIYGYGSKETTRGMVIDTLNRSIDK